MNVVYWPGEPGEALELGGKASSLAALEGIADLHIPRWFVVLPEALRASLEDAGWKNVGLAPLRNGESGMSWDRLPSAGVRRAIEEAVGRLCPGGEPMAVRSSARGEDGQHHSFAGQLESHLNVEPGQVVDRVVAVWKSAFAQRVGSYLDRRALEPDAAFPAVLVQQMVHADRSGVAFSADPVTGRRGVAVLAAVRGLGTALVNGDTDADTWRVDRHEHIIERTVAPQGAGDRAGQAEAVSVSPGKVDGRPAVLSDAEVLSIVRLVRRVARHFGRPQDIEWAYESGRLHLLQARPITTLATMVDPDGSLRIWDNSNITESYSGVTTPLTFSFARRAYEGVYRQFCLLLAVPRSKVASHQATFRQMLGLVQGRVYYNLLNWYRVLALLPGFQINRRFMEQMMGVKEPLPEGIVSDLDHASATERLRDGLRLVTMIVSIVANHWLLERRIRAFYRRIEEALRQPSVEWESMSAEELCATFLQLEAKLLTRWDAPLLNDFFTMIYSGLLRRLTTAWCGDSAGELAPGLLAGGGDIISAEPARQIARLAELARNVPNLVEVLRDGSLTEIRAALREAPDFQRNVESYLAKFGNRCPDELKLESQTLHDDPMPLWRSIGRCAAGQFASSSLTPPQPGAEPGLLAEREALARLAGKPLRRTFFQWVLRHARARTRDRENLRFERTRVFAAVRRIVIELGKRLAADGRLPKARAVFYLELDEILGFFSATTTTADLGALSQLREAEFDNFRRSSALPRRIQTHGSPHQGNQSQQPAAFRTKEGSEARQGTGCSSGSVRGEVRVVVDPRSTQLQGGEILVARHTDPGWILLFPGARGLLVERGSLLSHSAIVARELGLPTIVGLEGLTDWLEDGDLVEMDGRSGWVRRLQSRGAGEQNTHETCNALHPRLDQEQATQPQVEDCYAR